MSTESTERKYRPPRDIELLNRACWCGSEESQDVLAKDRWGEPLKVVSCSNCGTLRLEPRLDGEGARQYYKESYSGLQYEPEKFFQSQFNQNADKLISKHIPTGASILDYGCGTGGKLARLREQGFQLYGYDINPDYYKFAIGKGLMSFDEDAKYDVLFLSHTIEHWTNVYEDIGRLIQKNLKPKGRVIIQVPLIDRLLIGARNNGLQGDVYFVHIWYFSVRSLGKLMLSLKCKRVYTDRVDLVVYEHDPNMPIKPIQRTPLIDRLLLTFITFFSTSVGRLLARVLNKIFRYINVYERQDVNG
jgi:SAM-dependent methyltransferase